MAKIGHSTLLNEEYMRVLERVSGAFSNHNIPYAVVGGSGVQVTIAGVLTGNGKASVAERKYELQWVLRPTDDIDLATKSDKFNIGTALQELSISDPSIDVPLPYSTTPIVDVKRKDGAIKHIHLNIQTEQEEFKGLTPHYEEVIETAQPVMLRYNAHTEPFKTYVALPELLIASKLTRSKTKDIVDITNLFRIMGQKNINRDRIRDILYQCDKQKGILNLDSILEDIM